MSLQEAVFSRARTSECPFACKHVERVVDYSTVSCPVAEHASASEGVWFTQPMLTGDRSDMDSIVEAVAKLHAHRDELKQAAESA